MTLLNTCYIMTWEKQHNVGFFLQVHVNIMDQVSQRLLLKESPTKEPVQILTATSQIHLLLHKELTSSQPLLAGTRPICLHSFTTSFLLLGFKSENCAACYGQVI